ncbi:hypothetical protein ACFPIJ_61675 [Dactylosporangium cerinum]|uniref:Uncharacterized protein n=1 Tax=Dactylosporangium cerinum TaxID=1434730 RepID=A0ABV9WLS4_9ACTN
MVASPAEIGDVLAAAGLTLVDHVRVGQVFAASPRELLDKVRARSLNNLAALPDAVFQRGLRALQRDTPHRRAPRSRGVSRRARHVPGPGADAVR